MYLLSLNVLTNKLNLLVKSPIIIQESEKNRMHIAINIQVLKLIKAVIAADVNK